MWIGALFEGWLSGPSHGKSEMCLCRGVVGFLESATGDADVKFAFLSRGFQIGQCSHASVRPSTHLLVALKVVSN